MSSRQVASDRFKESAILRRFLSGPLVLGCVRCLTAAGSQSIFELGAAIVGLHAPLFERIAVADRHGAVGERLAVDRDAERRADLVLTAIAAADRALLVVEDVETCGFRAL